MSEIDDFLAQLNDGGGNGDSGQSPGGQLRKQLEQVLAQNKQLQEQLAQTQASERTRAIDALFERHKVPALAKDFFPSEAQPTDEVVTGFVEKYGALWGATSASATTPPDQQAATHAVQQFSTQVTPPVTADKSEDDYRAQFAEANTRAELLQMLSQLGTQIPD